MDFIEQMPLLGAAMTATRAWTFGFVTITFMIYLYIGWRSRVKESGEFYVAGQGVPAIANGAATAADWMSAASFISMAGLISGLGSDGSVFLLGWTGGYVLLAMLLAPYLRKFGQYTVPDFVAKRYYSETARIVAAVCAVFISITYVAGQMRGVGIVFARFLEVETWQGVVLGMVIVGVFAVLGGMKGITWTQVVQFFVLIAAFLIPTFALSGMLTDSSVPQIGFTTGDIAEKVNLIQEDLGFSSYTQPFTNYDMANVFFIMFALMAGTAGLPHVIVRFYTVANVRAARYSAFWALLFICLLYTSAPVLAMFARYSILNTLEGAHIGEVAKGEDEVEYIPVYRINDEGKEVPIQWVDTWQKTGLIKIDDKNKDGILSLRNVNGNFDEVTIDKDILVLATPEIAQLSPWVIAIVATGGLAAALSTAAGLLLVISSSMAHDLYVHFFEPNASEPRRLFIARIMIIGAILVAGYFGIAPPGFIGEVVAFAFGLAAASFFPIIFLGIFDKRMNRQGATSGMIVGILFTAIYIILCRSDRVLGFDEPLMTPWFQGSSWMPNGLRPEGVGAIGLALNFIVAMTISRLTAPPPEEVQDLVESVRVPRGSHAPEAHFDETDAEADNP
ncbi:sodium:solute symporter family protein [Bremerella sp. P1]|uniref:sodium:solute symporter family protein n=1 Tax=Bremerella sp. P1 TaxID=3026424 RepID=UPI00236751F1|nr:sodium:solute symporter family protein [Bremerella sp. P1]WDI44020.1 cation acetate symporter [Bremerella sp. P1]